MEIVGVIYTNACPRCQGAVMEFSPPTEDNALCIICGWRRREVSREIQAQVMDRMGLPEVEDRHVRSRMGTGKPPLSGWDRVKLRRQREAAH